MNLLSGNFFIKIFKNLFLPIIILIIFVEVFFQIIFFFDIKSLKKTILYFNPYCDQAYWNFEGNSSYDKEKYSYHPILTITKKKNDKFFNKEIYSNSEIIFYGSSFIDHKYFLSNYTGKTNFAVKSYGFDQIYKSYKLTKDKFKNNTIIIGFLLEDIDRSLFHQRNFPKLKYIKKNNIFELTNTPIKFNSSLSGGFHVYSYNFIKNVSFLILNNFNYKKSKCYMKKKIDIFNYLIDKIILQSKKLNQNLIFVTFNFKDDVIDPSWRYEFVKNLFISKNINHIDVLNIIKEDIIKNNYSINKYYNDEDLHLSEYGFSLVRDYLNNFITQYK